MILPSLAFLSIFLSSSLVNFKLFNAAKLSFSWATERTPIKADVTALLFKTQASANWERD